MREICTYGSMRGRAYPTRGVPLYSTPSESPSGDWYTALGRVSVHYEVVEYDDQYVAFASFEDTYDFHDIHFNAPFDGLSLVGSVFGWYGGDWVKDVWMKNLADNGWATVFKTTCEWVFYIQKE